MYTYRFTGLRYPSGIEVSWGMLMLLCMLRWRRGVELSQRLLCGVQLTGSSTLSDWCLWGTMVSCRWLGLFQTLLMQCVYYLTSEGSACCSQTFLFEKEFVNQWSVPSMDTLVIHFNRNNAKLVEAMFAFLDSTFALCSMLAVILFCQTFIEWVNFLNRDPFTTREYPRFDRELGANIWRLVL